MEHREQPAILVASNSSEELHAEDASSWKTLGGSSDRLSYTAKLALIFACTAAMTVILLVGIWAVVWENQFQSYTKESMATIAQRTASIIGARYDELGGWSHPSVTDEAWSVPKLWSGIGIQVLDSSDTVVMDSTWIDATRDTRQISLAPPRSHMVQAQILSPATNKRVGTVRVWSYGSEMYLTQKDIDFRNNSYKAAGLAAVIAVCLALVCGFVFSRTLVKPVQRITKTANRIKDGDLEARTGLIGTDEISQLGETIDAMASSIQQDRELERRLTTDVAHELRTPLMAIQSTVEAMQDGVLPVDSERLATLGAETKRLSRLVDALLHLSRLESGSIAFEFMEMDVIELAAGIARSHEALIADSGMELRFVNETGKQELKAEIDPDRMHQALVNLISNAVRYTDEGGQITVSVGVEKNRKLVWISVADTGIGIEPEDLKRVFSRFWRAEESRTRASGGLGVGLSVTKEVIDRHHGYIEVTSTPGKGTTFTLFFPRMQKGQGRHDSTISARD